MSAEYNESQIQVLEGLEAVRKRPGMYIGSTGERGLHHLVYEIVDNAVDEALAGFCSEITVKIHPDNSVSVLDNGRGVPVGIHHQKGISALEVVFTILHAGGKFGGGGYKVSGGLHGVGASVVNALSEWLTVRVCTDGKIYEQKYSRGNVLCPVTEIGETEEHGTFVHFLPDAEIFEETVFSYDTLKQRLRETAFLTKGLKINLIDLREGMEQERTYHYEGGIKEFVAYINKNRQPLYDSIFYASGEKDGILVEVAFQHNDGYTENMFTFVNNINTPDGGTHLVGFKSGLTKTINDYGKKIGLIKDADKKLSGDDVREGMSAVISIKVEDPQFEGQTKAKLGTTEAKAAVEAVLSEYLTYFLEENPAIGKIIIEKGMMASRAREAARKARELVRHKTGLENTRLPGKLTDCTSNNPLECEIYIVEGNSAGGSAIKARNPLTQAILPLRGKILNVEKARMDRILSSEEIKNMILAFGTGISDDFDLEKLRYHKIVIMTDADVDGAHIRTLLLTFFYRYMPQLIEEGKVYIAQPPLYRVEKNKQHYYVYDDTQLEELYNEIGRDNIKEVQRYKGLGEMDYDQLRDTTMAVEHRILKKVTIGDALLADEIFSMLMGDSVEPRKEFIEENAQYAEMDF
ncbi:DNA topoisomerase (ATP-hydrolyzing) subunit B [Anaerotignum lactatifermentans]|uniref:DNA gyrase subunit B n=1 Tax=Anaerotignum lactatifermentans TaxID=160404 RepID=A0ABS2GAV4_9FIRM|nr:DNA topoisomerase (ATP-hydrolyzing) subunit B [Anaerotignum lactatifermentans]MBM6830059.1 DNA topoisomerase (ATP-hydrolyzing) subunit B [Anaerotignum lactatifermentans]MBM6878302.1 DNA topoisomerase (ATP-hydrolyzing) subunit B [Anaerotignum lactatifermentans]MBM6951457.1 DNA topoisomerase (ATP-hydrolyzing) subunit B [Anaerotignum lactatifermentans]